MGALDKNAAFLQMMEILAEERPREWQDIPEIIAKCGSIGWASLPASLDEFKQVLAAGCAFLTFDFGIDGVSIEIGKYARALASLFEPNGGSRIHLIGGEFYPQADAILKPEWPRFQIEGTNGWSKWDEGKWFDAMFFEDMSAGSQRSGEIATEIYRQAVVIAEKLSTYLVANDIRLLVTVNVASNPGNLALTLALVLVTEALGIHVINSNHDFYWEGGRPVAERSPAEEPGIRDHFFRNIDNEAFFSLFKSLYPWDGRRWLQVNINKLQSEYVREKLGFPREKVLRVTTSVGDSLFADFTFEDVKSARMRMGYILSDGQPHVTSSSAREHLEILAVWMAYQRPSLLGAHSGLSLDPSSEQLIYLLQPTRVIARKRIERNVELIGNLLQSGALRAEFERNPDRQIVLHITGPTPVEHQEDLEAILQAYLDFVESFPASIAERVFLAFSVGHQEHASFESQGFQSMNIVDIFRMATAVLFPSEVEGRGLPIIEAGAVGVPIISSRYRPKDVFYQVVGEFLDEEQQIQYIHFPEGEFSDDFLDQVADLLLDPQSYAPIREHNRNAVRLRYSETALRTSFERFIERLWTFRD